MHISCCRIWPCIGGSVRLSAQPLCKIPSSIMHVESVRPLSCQDSVLALFRLAAHLLLTLATCMQPQAVHQVACILLNEGGQDRFWEMQAGHVTRASM